MDIYLDLAVILNFIVDFLLLLGTNRLAGFPLDARRCALAAALGGIYGGACLIPGFSFLGSLLWRTVCLALMAGLAFGLSKSAFKRGGVFLLLSLALGGLAESLGQGDILTLCLAAGGIWGLCRAAFGERVGGQEYVPLHLNYEGKNLSLTALRDTGNTLRDPVTGEPVFLICGQAAETLTGLSQEALRHPLETLAQRPISGLRLIPYRAVGSGSGMLLGLKFRDVKLGNKTLDAVVAFAPEGLGSTCQALVTA